MNQTSFTVKIKKNNKNLGGNLSKRQSTIVKRSLRFGKINLCP